MYLPYCLGGKRGEKGRVDCSFDNEFKKIVIKNTVMWCFNVEVLFTCSLTVCVVFYVGSGGNNHAVDYYKETSYPLAVKLGTITPDGAGTVINDC